MDGDEPVSKRSRKDLGPTVAYGARVRAAMLGAHIGDAFAFPYHWYYSYDILQKHMDEYYQPDDNGFVYEYKEVLSSGYIE